MQPKVSLLEISIIAAGISLSQLAFAQGHPGNPEPAATPSPSMGQGESSSSVKEPIGNAASEVKEKTKSTYHRVGSAPKSSELTAKAKAALLIAFLSRMRW